jgi:hypothetical protein
MFQRFSITSLVRSTGYAIMGDQPLNPQHFVDAQADVFRLAKRDHGLNIARLSALTRIPENTLRSWCNGTSMPAWAMVELSRHIPASILNMLWDGSGNCIAKSDKEESTLDQLACVATGFTYDLLEAKSDGKVTPIEKARLIEAARKVQALAASVVA